MVKYTPLQKFYRLLPGVCMLIGLSLTAQDRSTSGAASLALGDSDLCLYDNWIGNNNPAGLSEIKAGGLALSYSSDWLIDELSSRSMVYNLPINNAAFGFSVAQFGFDNYQENQLGMAYGMKVSDRFSAGLQILYHELRLLEPYGSDFNLNAKLGLIAKLNAQLSLATVIENPHQNTMIENNAIYSPRRFRSGLLYSPQKDLRFHLALEKELNKPLISSLGVEYQIEHQLKLRLGCSPQSQQLSVGFAYLFQRFQVDIASIYNPLLGFTPAISIAINQKKIEDGD